MRYLMTGAAALALAACGGAETSSSVDETPSTELVEDTDELEPAAEAASSGDWGQILSSDRRGENDSARDADRNPQATLEFFGVKPGMTVAEALPTGGWYSKILLPYLGPEGGLIGIDYAPEMWALFAGIVPQERIDAAKTWPATWTAETNEWRSENDAPVVGAYQFGSVSDDVAGTADVVLFIRALHNVNRFEETGGYRTTALKDAYDVLKPGGVVGVVQHAGPETNDDAWATGANGYLKESQVIEAFETAGFELVETSDINANPKDQPTNEDIVWRLPPSLVTSGDNPELAEQMKAIGESNRMTLKFRKPA